MLHLLTFILGIFLTIFFVIGTHEYAHFFVARLLGVKVLRFSIGFGKTLYRWFDRKGTEYVIAIVPLGGYVKMLDEYEGEVKPDERHLAYNYQSFYKKFLIVLAGPVMNIFCAFLLYWLVFVIGFTTIKPIIGSVKPNSIAAEAGLKPNTEIISVDNKQTDTWSSIIFRMMVHIGNIDHVRIATEGVHDQKADTHILDVSNWHMDGLSPDPLGSLGITAYEPNIPLTIGFISPKAPAASSTLKLADKIVAINRIPVKTWENATIIISNHPNESIPISVIRDHKTLKLDVAIGAQKNIFQQKSGYLGIGPNYHPPKEIVKEIKYSPLQAVTHAWDEVSNLTYFNLLLFGKMITGKLSLQSLGGPITIFESAGESLSYGFVAFISFLAFLSLSLGIINLLPIPGLDGGHLFMQLVELIIRRPVPENIMLILYRIGFALILIVLVQAVINDVLRLH